MAWGSPSGSSMFRAFLADALTPGTITATGGWGWATVNPKAALYDNNITPDNDVTSANSAYGAGVWTAVGGATGGNQVYQAGQWAQAGVAMTTGYGLDRTGTADTIFYDYPDTASGASCTISNVFGCLVYNDTATAPVADQGISFNYFGGTQSVSAGTFTIVWSANGVWRVTAALG